MLTRRQILKRGAFGSAGLMVARRWLAITQQRGLDPAVTASSVSASCGFAAMVGKCWRVQR